jgi:Electron transfer DM13
MKNIFLFILCVFVFSFCKNENEPKPEINVLEEPMASSNPPENAQALRMSAFISYAHNLAGRLILYVDITDKRTLRFEEFKMTQGPDVYVFLSKSNNYSKANVIPIAKLAEEYNNASIHFNINASIDLTTYKFVLIYCVQYNSLFGYTELK